jgi:hypothetical protein
MKLEIKFENPTAIYQLLKHAIERSFGVMEDFGPGMEMGARPGAPAGFGRYGNAGRDPAGNYKEPDRYSPPEDLNHAYPGSHGAPGQYPGMETQGPHSPSLPNQLFPGNFFNDEDFFIIGQYKNSYILVEKNNDLLLIDQHNAQERINFDQLKKEYREDKVLSISPLFPVIMELSPSETAGLDDRKCKLLEKAGFRLESLGGNTYDIKSFPQVLGEKNIKDAVRTVIHLNVESKEDETGFEDQVLAEIACKSAIKINHKLYPDQMKTIVKNLFNTGNPYFCPHQRPVIVEFTLEQIEKLLKRK